VRIVGEDGKVVVRRWHVKVVAALPDTGAGGVGGTAAAALALGLAGWALRRIDTVPTTAPASQDTIDP
jgi:LPXTG-motif cell wall-anchored protein